MEENSADEENQVGYKDGSFLSLDLLPSLLLGPAGRMTHRSKSAGGPKSIFNANIFNSIGEKIWYGDLELSWEHDVTALWTLSKALGTIYVLYEFDGRFLWEKPTPAYVKSVAAVTITNGEFTYSEHQEERMRVLEERRRAKLLTEEKDGEC